MSCEGRQPQFINYAHNDALRYSVDAGGAIVVSVDPDTPLTGGAEFTTGVVEQPNEPMLFEWKLYKFDPSLAVGLSLDGNTGVLGTGLANVYYRMDGGIAVNGALIGYAPAVSEGDVVGIWFDPLNHTVAFWLNGDRVA